MTPAVPPPGVTIGVEEEFLVVDGDTGRPSAEADLVVASAARTGLRITPELTPTQIELVSPVCSTMVELEGVLRRQRKAAVQAADEHGLRLVASGTPVTGRAAPPPWRDHARYQKMAKHFGAMVHEQGTCGLHVHVGVHDADLAVRACGYLRPALAVLLAISVNSPFHAGLDSGHESWRAVLAARWPTVEPPPLLFGRADRDLEVARLRRFGLAVDRGGIYWWARPSELHPTVEVRIADTQPEVEDTLLIVALVRALVRSAVAAAQREEPWPTADDTEVRAAIWSAARGGLAGPGIDPDCGRLTPHTVLLDRLLSVVRPHLEETEDWETTVLLLERLRGSGTGASRQRAAVRRAGALSAAVEAMTLR